LAAFERKRFRGSATTPLASCLSGPSKTICVRLLMAGRRLKSNHIHTVGETLSDLMALKGWSGVKNWKKHAKRNRTYVSRRQSENMAAPICWVTRTRPRENRPWAKLGVDGLGIADEPPAPDFVGMPKLTVRMCARLQGFPDDWEFPGRKNNILSANRKCVFRPQSPRAVAEQLKAALSVKKADSICSVR